MAGNFFDQFDAPPVAVNPALNVPRAPSNANALTPDAVASGASALAPVAQPTQPTQNFFDQFDKPAAPAKPVATPGTSKGAPLPAFTSGEQIKETLKSGAGGAAAAGRTVLAAAPEAASAALSGAGEVTDAAPSKLSQSIHEVSPVLGQAIDWLSDKIDQGKYEANQYLLAQAKQHAAQGVATPVEQQMLADAAAPGFRAEPTTVSDMLKGAGTYIKRGADEIMPEEKDQNVATKTLGGVANLLQLGATEKFGTAIMGAMGADEAGQEADANGVHGKDRTDAVLASFALNNVLGRAQLAAVFKDLPAGTQQSILQNVKSMGLSGLENVLLGRAMDTGQRFISATDLQSDQPVVRPVDQEDVVNAAVGAAARGAHLAGQEPAPQPQPQEAPPAPPLALPAPAPSDHVVVNPQGQARVLSETEAAQADQQHAAFVNDQRSKGLLPERPGQPLPTDTSATPSNQAAPAPVSGGESGAAPSHATPPPAPESFKSVDAESGPNIPIYSGGKEPPTSISAARGQKPVTDLTDQEKTDRLYTDSLTGLKSRTWFEDQPTGQAVLLADMDGLKAVNDTYGHESGDALITAAGQAWQQAKAETQGPDVARWGGDEFGAHGDADKLTGLAERANAILGARTFEFVHPDGTIKTESGFGFSYGIAPPGEGEHVLKQADQILQQHKLARRDAGARVRPSEVTAQGDEPAAAGDESLPNPAGREAPVPGPEEVAPSSVDTAAADAATHPDNDTPAPTEAQIEAGNYAKGHVRLNGLDISIENPKGTSRRPEWPPLTAHYGYIKGTEGHDGDHVDVFMGPHAEDASKPVYVVDQIHPDTGRFDEHKVLMGYGSEQEARDAYQSNYAPGWKGLGGITEMSQPEFKDWVRKGDTKKPLTKLPRSLPLKKRAVAEEPSLRRDTDRSKAGMEPHEVQSVVDDAVHQMKVEPDVTVERKPRDVFPNAPEDAEGAHKGGLVYLFSDNLHSPDHAAFALAHEMFHRGLSRMDEGVRTALAGIYRSNDELRALARQWMKANNSRDIAKGTEEALADLVGYHHGAKVHETPELKAAAERFHDIGQVNGWRRLMTALRAFVRKAFPKLKFTDDEIHGLVADALAKNDEPVDGARFTSGGPSYARRLMRTPYRSDNDFIIPDTPEFKDNTSGDLSRIPPNKSGIEELPIRLHVGRAVGEHRGYGIMHLADNAKLDKRREPPAKTDDRAENYAQHVAHLARSFTAIYRDGRRLVLQTPRSREALVVEERTGRDDEPYYSVVSMVPSDVTRKMGRSVWTGRNPMEPKPPTAAYVHGDRPEGRSPGEAAPVDALHGRLPPASDRPSRDLPSGRGVLGVRTEQFTLPRDEEDGQEPQFSRPPKGTVAGAEGNSPVLDSALDKAGLKEEPSLQERVRAYFDQGSDVIKQDLETARNRIVEGLFDRFHGIKTAQFKAKGLLPAEQDAYVAARLSTGTPTVLSTLMAHGHLEWKDGILQVKPGTRGLLDILKPVSDDLNAWMGWMIGNRAKRLAAEGKENLFKPEEIQALIDLGKGKEELFKQVRAEYAELKTSVLKVAADAGLLDEEGMKAWDHADHIPFYRLTDEERVQAPGGHRGLSHQNSGIRQLKGGTAALNDPLENILMNFTHLLDASLKNHAVRLVEQNLRDTGVLEKLGPEYTQALVPMSQVKKLMEDAGVDTSMAGPEVLNGVRKMLAFKPPSDPDVIRVMDKGKASYYRVKDAPLLRALTAFNEKSMGGVMQPLRFFKRVLTGASTVSPGFMARVWVRDSLTANVIAKHKFPVVWGSAKGLYKSLTEKGGQVDLMAAGASFHGGNISAHDPQQNARLLRRMLRRKGFDAASTDHFISTIVDTPAHAWEMWRRGSEAVENSNREAVYEAALKAGESKAEAAYNAKDLLDYSMRGNFALVKFFTDAIPFLNARLQGLYKIGRAGAIPGIAEDGFKAKVAGKAALSLAQKVAIRGAMISMASLALYAYNRNDKRYQQLPDWDKDTYWHIFIGDQHYRIPKPFEVGLIFGTMPERWARLVDGDDTLRKSFDDWVWNIGQVLNMDPIPQAIKPAYSVWANKDSFSGNPIENESDQALLPADRYSSATSPTLVDLGRHVSDQTGLSPKQMQELYSGYTGALGMFVLSMVDDGTRLMEHQPPQATSRIDEMPPFSSFIRGSGPARQTQWEQDFYNAREQVNQTYASIKKQIAVAQLAGDEGAVARMQKLLDAGQDNLGLRDSLNNAAEELSAIRQRIDLIQADDKMTPDEKREAIDELYQQRNDMMEKVYSALPDDLK